MTDDNEGETSAEPRASRGSGLVGRLSSAIDAAEEEAQKTSAEVLRVEALRDTAWALLRTLKSIKDS